MSASEVYCLIFAFACFLILLFIMQKSFLSYIIARIYWHRRIPSLRRQLKTKNNWPVLWALFALIERTLVATPNCSWQTFNLSFSYLYLRLWNSVFFSIVSIHSVTAITSRFLPFVCKSLALAIVFWPVLCLLNPFVQILCSLVSLI